MSETEETKELSWDDAKCDPGQEYKIKRKVAKGEYELVYKDMTGDEFETFTLATRAMHSRNGVLDEKGFNTDFQRKLRKRIIVSVMGKKYEELDDRVMQPWLLQDLNDFIIQYIQGNVK
jgi:hypothetical protein